MNWYRIALFTLGIASVTIGALVPATTSVLMPAGTFLIGLGLRTPGDPPPPPPAILTPPLPPPPPS